MTDTALTLDALNKLFQSLTLQMLGLSATAYDKVRLSWPTEGAPSWKITDDVAFLRCFETDNPYNRQRDVEHTRVDDNTLSQATAYTRVNSIEWIFYGPYSYERAQAVRDQIFYQLNRDTLERNNVYLVPDIAAPRRVPEAFQGQWWERVDLTIRFNELTVRNISIGSIASVPVSVTAESGDTITETIS
jgi:hypothetical protein